MCVTITYPLGQLDRVQEPFTRDLRLLTVAPSSGPRSPASPHPEYEWSS